MPQNNDQTQEHTGTVSQPLVGGGLVPADIQEEFGLLTLGDAIGSCSASLLRNDWAITAAHCVEIKGADGLPVPDPSRPGQFVLVPPNTVTLTANWASAVQQRQAVRIETFRPFDVALIQVAAPFSYKGATTGYSRLVFQDGQFPYWGEEVPVNITIFGRGINQFAQGSGPTATPSQSDGQYRVGYAQTTSKDDNFYHYSNNLGASTCGGDSGGPSYAWVLEGYALMGVHSYTTFTCLPGKTCGNWPGPGPAPGGYNPWMWVTSTPGAADARIEPIWSQISQIIGPAPVPPDPDPPLPPPGYIGTFGTTPPDYHPIWLYAIQNDGVLLWYRKDTGASPWQGPKPVGSGWAGFKDVIPAGGNSLYALTTDGRLQWYQHDGFNDGSFAWKGPVEVGQGWNFSKILSGSDGIIYAIQQDGTLLWYQHGGFTNGGGISTWIGPRVIGSDWVQFKDVFSTGQGTIYAVQPDGTLLRYQHTGFATGDTTWESPRTVGSSWQSFQQIVPVGNGVILAIKAPQVFASSKDPFFPGGHLLWYKDVGIEPVPKPSSFSPVHWEEQWEGPVEIGTGWQYFKKVVALLPATPPPLH